MAIEFEIISTEYINPSSPTPESLRKYDISFLDQKAPPFFMALVYFYPSSSEISNSQKLNDLKHSLSLVLTKFYPLAGRFVDNRYIDCNDEGAPFVVAKADCNLTDVIEVPNPHDMNRFCAYPMDDIKDICTAVQVTFFQCGGLAVGLQVSHKVADALSFFKFANSWAAVARHGDADVASQPKFGTASIFPPHDVAGSNPVIINDDSGKEDIICKIFTFPESKISQLRDAYAATDVDGAKFPKRRPSRYAVLSTFMWTRFISATDQLKLEPRKTFAMVLPINLRTRMNPPLSEDCFGNITEITMIIPTLGEDGGIGKDYELPQKVMEAIGATNGEHNVEGGEKDKFNKLMSEGEVFVSTFTSLCRFPMYETDYGWGKPAWVGSVAAPCANIAAFIDTAAGDGIEAWVNLKREAMRKFEADLDLQAFANFDIGN